MKDQTSTVLQPARPAMEFNREQELLPLFLLEQIADNHATEVWGDMVARGRPIPVLDTQGQTSAYWFPFITGSRQFPEEENIFGQLRVLREKMTATGLSPESLAEWDRFTNRFGTVLVAATHRDFPVLMVTNYLHPFFTTREELLAFARQSLGWHEVEVGKILFVNAHEEYLEIFSGEERLFVDLHSQGIKRPKEVLTAAAPERVPAALQERIEAAWERVLKVQPPDLVDMAEAFPPLEMKIKDWKLVPPVPHTWWCVPTSYNMVAGYYDHFVPGLGTFTGYGRINKKWFEHATHCHYADGWHGMCNQPNTIPNNVPNITDELIDPATGTWRAGFNGFADFVQKMYQYTFTSGGPAGGKPVAASNDWAWSDIVKEVNADRPFFWSFAAHTVVGIGYRIDKNGKRFIIYLDTYGATLQQKLKELDYSKGNGFTWAHFSGGTNPDHAMLTTPRDSEILFAGTPAEVKWFVYGNKIDGTRLEGSVDAGKTWTLISDKVETKPGWNAYRWLPGVANKARVKIEAFDQQQLIAGDGSFQNFRVEQQTMPGTTWKKIFGPADVVLAGLDKATGKRVVYATELATGDIYQFMGIPGVYFNWIKVGGPGKKFVLDGRGRLYGLTPDGKNVFEYQGTPLQWKHIGGPAATIYGDIQGPCLIEPGSGDIYRYLGSPNAWLKIGGPGKTFCYDANGHLYGLSPDGSGVYRYDGLFGPPQPWIKVGGPAADLFGRGKGIFATNPASGDVYFFHGLPFRWTKVGGPGKAFSVDVEGRLYGLAPDAKGVWRHGGSYADPQKWDMIGGPASMIFAGWREVLALSPNAGEVYIYCK